MPVPAMTPINAKVRPDEKELFIRTCDSIGTTPSNAIRMFVSAFNKYGGFPFDSRNPQATVAESPSNTTPPRTGQRHAKANRAETLDIIRAACSEFPAIRAAYLFGSMARNTFTDESDVDTRLVLDRSMPFNLRDLAQFSKRVEQATHRKVDVVSSDEIANENLAAAIERDKVLAYEREE